MATLLHGESRRMYSWWWDSHISPKNSKWLQENLTDMDRNVKAMIKLIEEDADSFARRAEMYYKKRPELMKFVEEFYRAYRALAERYNHATGALHQAHRTMVEAFPNQIPPIMSDESPSSGSEFGPHIPEVPSPMRAPMDLDDLQKDVLGLSPNFHDRGRNGAYSEESNLLSSMKGLKQLKEMFPSGEGLTRAKSEGMVRKVLNFKDEEGKTEEKDDLKSEIKRLQGEVSQLTTRNENLMTQMASESQHARILEETISKLETVKETTLLQYMLSIERMSSLEADICNTRHELNMVNDEMVVKLNSIEEQCLAMEKANKSLQLELENQQKELEKRGRELEELDTLIKVEHQKRMQAEVALMSLEQIHTHSQEAAELLILEIQCASEKLLKEMELNKVGLEQKISELNKIIGNLHEQNISFDLKIRDLQDEMKLLKETKEELEHEFGIYMEERKALQDELFCIKEVQRDLEQRNLGLTEQMEVVSEKNIVLKNSLSDANVELEGLREKANALEAAGETLLCEVSTHVVEKGVLVSQIEIISQNLERLSGKCTSLENSLSDANAELEGLRARFKDMEECCMSLCDQNSTYLAEKNALVSQVENLENKYLELQNQHLILEEEKDSKVHQVMELQCSITLEKQEHDALLLSSSSQLASLHNQFNLLEEQFWVKMEDFELEQQEVMNSLLEIFILKSYLREMNNKNLFLFDECKNLLEAARCAENQISQLKHTEFMQKEELTSLSECNGVLIKGIHLLLEALSIDVNQGTADDITEEVLVQIILVEIKNLLNSLLDTRDENRQVYLQVLNIETKCLTLQDQLANLEKEKDSAVHQVMDLESSLRLEKEKHEALILVLSSQLASLENQIHLLQKEIRVRDEELEVEQQNIIKAHLENFVLQRCLCDMKDNNLILSGECQNLVEAHRCAEKQISELEHKGLIQNEELILLSDLSNNLRARIHLLLEALNLDIKKGTMDDPTDEAVLETISGEIRNYLSSISDVYDENQCLHLELLVLVTLFKQIGVDNFQLHHELESRTKELLALSSENLKLMEMSKQLEDENTILVSKVETRRLSLEMLETEFAELEDKNLNLEIKYAELEDKNLNLEREKDLSLHQILELENSLELEKQEHHALISSSKSQIASLATQLDLLQEERQVKEAEFEREQKKASDVLLENFILQRCLNDMKDRNLILSEECQKLSDTSRRSDKLISEAQHECLIQQKEMKLISENNEKLRNGILLMLEELNIHMDCGTVDGTKEVILQTLLDQIKTMLNSVLNVHEESQCLSLEISVLGTLLKEIGLEKVHLYYELGSRNDEVLSLQEKKDEAMKKNEQLKAEMQILVEQLSDLHASHRTSQTEIHNLHEANLSLSKRFYDLKEKMVALEERNSGILAEALTLDHLFIFFKAQNTERGLKLKLLSDNICSILAVKNGLNEENRVQIERIRKLELQTMNLNESAILQEFNLNIARNFCEEFILQIEAAENLLLRKEMELSEAREENTELYRKLENMNMDFDGAIVMQRELKREIYTLSLGIVSKEGEIREILEANRFLHKELDRLNYEVEVLRRREEYLTSELQKGISEASKCEGEIQTLLEDIQISTVNAAIFEEKLLEQIVACESLQSISMLLREMLGEEIALKNACADELKKELDNLEGENVTLKADLNAYSPLLMSLFDGVSCVEELIYSLAKLQDKQVNDTSDASESKKSSHRPSKKAEAGFLDLQKLITKVEALQKVIIDSTNLLQQERLDSNAKMEAAKKEIKELKLKEILLQEKSKDKYGQIMKDIQLDQVSRSRVSSYSANKNENGESDDQMLELWETAERDDIEAVEEVKSEYPSSELIAEKELSIDKLEVSTRVNESSPQVWNKRFIEKLDSDAQRLSVLQRSLQELKTKLESSEKKVQRKTSEFGTLKAQLREAEEAISEQIDINGKLKKKVENNFESFNAVIWEKERRQVSEQARRGSEKIAKLELELQTIEYVFLKVEEEEEYMGTGCVDRKSSTLRDYISGRRDGRGKRKGPFCGCMRPKTMA